jgi:hypothetical protein
LAGHAPQAAHFHLAPERVVLVPLRLRAIEKLQASAIHLHTRHGGRRLIGGHDASCGDRQGFVGRGLSVTLRHALVANPLRRATYAFSGNVQFGELFQIARALRKTRRLRAGIDDLLQGSRTVIVVNVQAQNFALCPNRIALDLDVVL